MDCCGGATATRDAVLAAAWVDYAAVIPFKERLLENRLAQLQLRRTP